MTQEFVLLMRLITFVLLQQVWKVGLIKTECNLCLSSCSGSSIVNILTSWDSLSVLTANYTLLNITQTGYKRSYKSYHNRPWTMENYLVLIPNFIQKNLAELKGGRCCWWRLAWSRVSRDSNGIFKQTLIQVILPYKISCIWGS